MEINFIGNGSAFSRTNNNAYFIKDNNLYLIDLSMLNMNKIIDTFSFDKYNSINIIITHMHNDHVSGIPTFLQLLFHKYEIVTNIICPEKLSNDIKTILDITGVHKEYYNIIDSNNIEFILKTILTKHSDSLKNGSYSYLFKLNNKLCLYTGDTASLDAYNKFINDCDEVYIDTSYNDVSVHVNWSYLKDNLPKCKNIYLMHLDDEGNLIEEVKKYDNVKVVEIYKGKKL